MSDIRACDECRGQRFVRYQEVVGPSAFVRAPSHHEPLHVAEKSRPCSCCAPVEFARWAQAERRPTFTLIETGRLPR